MYRCCQSQRHEVRCASPHAYSTSPCLVWYPSSLTTCYPNGIDFSHSFSYASRCYTDTRCANRWLFASSLRKLMKSREGWLLNPELLICWNAEIRAHFSLPLLPFFCCASFDYPPGEVTNPARRSKSFVSLMLEFNFSNLWVHCCLEPFSLTLMVGTCLNPLLSLILCFMLPIRFRWQGCFAVHSPCWGPRRS